MTKMSILMGALLFAAASALAQTPTPTPTLLPWPSGVPTPTPGGPTPTPIFLSSITIAPQNPTIPVGGSVHLTATGTWGTSIKRQNQQVTWSSDNEAVAEVQNVDQNWIGQGSSFRSGGPAGTVTGISAGTVTITARFGLISASTTVTVTGAAPPMRAPAVKRTSLTTLSDPFAPIPQVSIQPAANLPTLKISNNSTTGLQVGDAFLTSVGAGNWNLGGGTYYTLPGGWTSNMFGSPFLISHGVNDGIRFWSGGTVTPGTAVPWTTEVNVNSTGMGVRANVYHRSIVSGARSWDGIPTVQQVQEMWLCNNCVGIVGKSGMVIVTETWHWGVTCVWVMGGGGWAWRVGTSRPEAPYCADGNGAVGGQFGIGTPHDGWFYLYNYIGADSVYNVMTLQTRDGQ